MSENSPMGGSICRSQSREGWGESGETGETPQREAVYAGASPTKKADALLAFSEQRHPPSIYYIMQIYPSTTSTL